MIRFFLVCLGIFLFLSRADVSAQEWVSAYNSSIEALEQSNIPEAEVLARKALQLFVAAHGESHKNVAAIHRQLALIYYEAADFEKSLYHALEEVSTLIALGEDGDFNFGNAIYNLALVRNARSEYRASEELFTQASSIYSDYLEQDDPEYLLLKGNWAISIFHQGRDREAESLFLQSFSILSQVEDPPSDYYNIAYNFSVLLQENGRLQESLHPLEVVVGYYKGTALPGYGNALSRMGDTYQQMGEFLKAEGYLASARQFFEDHELTTRPEYQITLNLLATNYQQLGRFDAAEEILIALARQQENIETADVSKVTTYLNLGSLMLYKGDYADANNWYSRVIEAYKLPGQATDEILARACLGASKIAMKSNDPMAAGLHVQAVDSVLQLLPAYSKELEVSLKRQRASVWLSSGKINEARVLLEEVAPEAVALWSRNSLQYGSIAATLGVIYQELADYSKADSYFADAIAATETFYGKAHPEYAILISNFASLKQLQGAFNEAEVLLLEALKVKEQHFGIENGEYLVSAENLATLYFQTARYQEAETLFQKVLEGNRTLYGEAHPVYAFSVRNLGRLKRKLGDYAAAEKLLVQASETLGNALGTSHTLYASSLNDLALLYTTLGNLSAAKPLFEQAKAGYELNYGKNHPDYATALENISTILQLEGKDDEALPLLEEALVVDAAVLGTGHPLYSKTLHNLASLYQKKGDLDKARELFVESLKITEQTVGNSNASYAGTLFNLAVLLQEKEEYNTAEEYFAEVLTIRGTLLGESHPDYAYSLFGLAAINQRQHKWLEALSYYEKTIQRYNFQIQKVFPALSEEEKGAFYAKIRPVYEAFSDFGVEYIVGGHGTDEDRQKVLELLYDVQLTTKALLLNASSKVKARILASNDKVLIEEFNSWLAAKEKLAKAYTYSVAELEKNEIDLAQLETEANLREKALSEKSTAFASEFDNQVITWKLVKEQLEESEAAVEIVRIKKNLKNDSVVYAGLILYGAQQKHIGLAFFPNGYEMEDKAFRQYKNSVVYKIKDEKSYSLYWKPFEEKLDNESTLYISSDGIFNKISLNTLFDPAASRFLLEAIDIHQLSNTRELVERSTKDARTEAFTATLFGFPDYELEESAEMLANVSTFDGTNGLRDFENGIEPLPGTLTEVNAISAMLGGTSWQHSTLLARDATEENFKKLNTSSLIHIATHGFFLEDFHLDDKASAAGIQTKYAKYNPLFRSGLLLAGASKTMQNKKLNRPDDGVLTAYEVMNLSLDQTELVVMSACETGLGEVKNGEGVYGLQRAFIVAGAKSIVMSLWKVNDETTQRLMTNFYASWFGGTGKHDAFKQAILEIKAEFPDPFYWGAFVMLGE